VEKMPKVYKHPAATKTPAGYTHYRVFVSPDRPGPPVAGFRPAFSYTEKVGLQHIVDGTPNTFMVAEAAEAVPWTKPDELEYEDSKPLPKLGGFGTFSKGFNALLCDGSVRWFPDTTDQGVLRKWITRDGGEVIPDLR